MTSESDKIKILTHAIQSYLRLDKYLSTGEVSAIESLVLKKELRDIMRKAINQIKEP